MTRPPSGHARYATAQTYAARLGGVYAQAEIALLTALAQAVKAALTGAVTDQQGARTLRVQAVAIVNGLDALTRSTVTAAAKASQAEVREILTAEAGISPAVLPVIPVTSLARLLSDLRNARNRAVQWIVDEYWRIIRQVRTTPPPGPVPVGGQGTTALLAYAQALLTALAAIGVLGKITATGAKLGLAAYAALAVAAAVASHHVNLQVRAMEAAGISLGYVWRESATPPCPKCAPWIFKVISLTPGITGPVSITLADGSIRTAVVAGTLQQALQSGLFHPNCRDSLLSWANGQLLAPPQQPPGWVTRARKAYERAREARKRQRARRAAARMGAVAITARARAQARRLHRHVS